MYINKKSQVHTNLEKSWSNGLLVINFLVHQYKSFQVLIKIKSKHVGGALSKKHKGKNLPQCRFGIFSIFLQFLFIFTVSLIYFAQHFFFSQISKYLRNNFCSFRSEYLLLLLGVVYGVCDETTAWRYIKERVSTEEVYFGIKTAQGLHEFECKSKVHKQRWVDDIKNLLQQVSYVEVTDRSLKCLSINDGA